MPRLSQLPDSVAPRPMAGARVSAAGEASPPPAAEGAATTDRTVAALQPRHEPPRLAYLERLAREELAALTPLLAAEAGQDLLEVYLRWDLAQAGQQPPGAE